MAQALRRQLDEVDGDCDFSTVVGLAAQDSGLHEREMHLRFHELTTGWVESAVESLIVTNCKFTSNKVTYFVQCWSVEQRTFECDPSLHRSVTGNSGGRNWMEIALWFHQSTVFTPICTESAPICTGSSGGPN